MSEMLAWQIRAMRFGTRGVTTPSASVPASGGLRRRLAPGPVITRSQLP
jgi:hypothetical protein